MNSRRTNIAITILCAIAVFLIAAKVLAADDAVPRLQVGASQRTSITGNKDHGFNWFSSRRNWRVYCDHGQSLAKFIRRAREHDTVSFYGTCYELITVKTDNLTIRGVGGATIDGSKTNGEAIVSIDGARGFVLEDFIVQNGSDQGILASHQAQGAMRNITARTNGSVGLSVDRSHVEIVDLTLDDNRSGGMDAYAGSTVVAKGQISANGNGGDGLAVNAHTFLELRGANVSASHNAGTGVSVINGSRMQILSFPEAQGTSINANNNGFAGIGLFESELGVVGSQYAGSGANVITANNNNVFGFFAPAGAIFSPHATAKFVAQGNGVGMLLEDGASAVIIGGLELTGNGAGISAHGAGTLTLVSTPPNPSNVRDNRVDIDIGFGTRLTVDQLGFQSIICDASVLTRGISCPDLPDPEE